MSTIINIPGDEASVPDAIVAASAGDTIEMDDGQRFNGENWNFDKPLVLRGLGATPAGVVLAPTAGDAIVFSAVAYGCRLENFMVEGVAGTNCIQAGGTILGHTLKDLWLDGGARGIYAYRRYMYILNCRIWNMTLVGITAYNYSALHTIVAKCLNGFQVSGGQGAIVQACLGVGNTTDDFNEAGTFYGGMGNISTDLTAPGGNKRTNFDTDNFADWAGNDFDLKPEQNDRGAKLIGVPFLDTDYLGELRKKTTQFFFASDHDPDPELDVGGWFCGELILSDPTKLEYIPDTARAACRLVRQVTDSDDFADLSKWDVVDSGGNINLVAGVVSFNGNNVWLANSMKRKVGDSPARAEGYYEIKWKGMTAGKYCRAGLHNADAFYANMRGTHLTPAVTADLHAMWDNQVASKFPLEGVIDPDLWLTVRFYLYKTDYPQLWRQWEVVLEDDGTQFPAPGWSIGKYCVSSPASDPPSFQISRYTNDGAELDYFKEWRFYSDYDVSGEDGSIVKDAGAGETWDGAELASSAADLAAPDGYNYTNVTFDVSYDDGSADWQVGKTFTQLKTWMEGITGDKRYFRLKGILNSDGPTQVDMMLPIMPAVSRTGASGGLLGANKRGNKQ